MLPSDADLLFAEIRSRAPVEVVIRDCDAADVKPLPSIPKKSKEILILWNKQLAPTLQRRWIERGRNGYYGVDYFALPVLEFSLSLLTEWQGRAALTQGRIYGQFGGKCPEFEKWFEQITRYIRRQWHSNPVRLLGGYLGPAASEWFTSGGLVLPMFIPPVTPEWTRVMDEQHTAKREHWKNFTSVESPSFRKLQKRNQERVCIGCGKNPCQCKNPRSRTTFGRG